MSWVVAAIGGGAALGYLNQSEQRKQKKQEMLANAAQIQYSPWTGMKGNVEGYGDTQSSLMGAGQGAVTGALLASQFNKTPAAPGAAKTTPGPTVAGGATDATANQNDSLLLALQKKQLGIG